MSGGRGGIVAAALAVLCLPAAARALDVPLTVQDVASADARFKDYDIDVVW